MRPHLSLVSGFLMGSADAVPGVSGGTIALILGIYERFIGALSTVIRFPARLRSPEGRTALREAFAFLVPLGIGVIAAYWLATRLLVGPEESPGWLRQAETAPLCYAFFFGLVLLSLREPWRRIRERHAKQFVAAVLGAAVAAGFVGLPYATAEPAQWMLLYGGALAISVMLLPGVSGSLLLVILGQYTTVAKAVHDKNLAVLGIFLCGVLIGLVLFVPFLRALLKRHHDVTMAALTGLMAGSLRALWPWKTNYEPKLGPMTNTGVGDDLFYVILAAGLGALTVVFLAWLEGRIERANGTDAGDPTSSA
ncbi:MAG: DUF368 domain-containing protein [Planctomycetota bacterium]|nr:DUF368 domain-containing protein [Planctomycetota bacterium]